MLKTMDCYNPVKFMTAAIFEADKLPALVRDWGGDMTNFLRHSAPKLAIIKTNPGYLPNPGHKGTGKVVAVMECP